MSAPMVNLGTRAPTEKLSYVQHLIARPSTGRMRRARLERQLAGRRQHTRGMRHFRPGGGLICWNRPDMA